MTRRYQTHTKTDPHGLTAGERVCADLLCTGMGATAIAGVLGITPHAVSARLSRVYRKLGVDCAAYAVDVLRGRGRLTELSEPFAGEVAE